MPPAGARNRASNEGPASVQWTGGILIGILALGAALRLYHLTTQGVWYDESYSIAHSALAIRDLLWVLLFDGLQAPLHYLVLHEWFQIAGRGVAQARIVSVAFGVASIYLQFRLARRFAGPAVSLVAAFLLAVSQIAIYFSREARPYAQIEFLSLLAALAFLHFLDNPDWRRSALFLAVGVALLFTHYYGAFSLLGLGMYWLIFRRRYSPLVLPRLCVIVSLLLLANLPWAATAVRVSEARKEGIQNAFDLPDPKSKFTLLGALNRFNSGKLESVEATSSPASALFGVLLFTVPAAAAVWRARGELRQGVILGCLLSGVPVVAALSLGRALGLVNYRHYSFASPGYYLAVAIGWSALLPNTALRAGWLALVSVLAAFAFHALQVPTKPDYQAGFLPLAENYHPGDCITSFPRTWYRDLHFGWQVYYGDRTPPREITYDALATLPGACDRLWLVWDQTWWMNRTQARARERKEALQRLQQIYTTTREFDHPSIRLQLLERKPEPPQPY